jgi:peptide/nickel transport system permease protein
MLRYLVHRLLIMIPTLIAISAIVFVIIQLPPGDYLTTYITELQAQGEAVSEDKIAFLRKQYGLGLPWYEQYFLWLLGLLQGNFGFSFEHNEPVVKVVGDVVWLSMIVASATIVFSWIVAFPIGVYSATRQYSWGDYTLSFLGFLGLATPSFLLALVLMYFANVWLGISIGGLMDERYIGQPWTWAKVYSILEHLWVPVLVIGAANTAGMIRRLRANLLDELQKQYVVTGRAKGLPPRRLLLKYPLRVALNPFVADIGNILPQIVSSAAVVAVVMSLPTTGPLLIRALRSQDMYLAGFLLMCLATLTVIGVLLSDIALALLDPRIRLQGGIRR